MDDIAGMTRMPSVPLDPTLLDILRADADILDLDGLEWALEDGMLAEGAAHTQQAGAGAGDFGALLPGMTELSSPSGIDDQVPLGWPAAPLQAPLHLHHPAAAATSGVKAEPGSTGGASGSEGAAWDTADQRQGRAPSATGTSAGGGGGGAQRATSRSRGPRDSSADGDGTSGGRKKRTRNSEQMAQNRVAQAKYRERKKAEQEGLASAVETLTAQLAALKAIEARAMELEGANRVLAGQVAAQAATITKLEGQLAEVRLEASAAQADAAEARKVAAAQQVMILDQHARLRMQEEVVEALRGRLAGHVEEAFGSHDPKTMCVRMCTAVRAALAGAKNVEGLQEALAALPEDVVTDLCRAILCEVKKTWPELEARWLALGGNKLCGGTPCGAATAVTC
mmetsp:Transcript_28087/g.71598  ORF Transcript_28087/g.71598 Transcript_28087/m.71598 type:complete len:397 (-) Transcript_28087:670-1860(-)|eukprot:CAMPEP_0202869648 /NCGR_PEP_ID=MMETSP1391-20130828/12568_1 /ASSEMBLY_ACC=CAM_ASM_000867 /TAXON_ID=1034604 /ORGANISM="Chlamydomonas leiostraca, Strain SAG 11-49" /LENGTH=396 /DNA_ID=CAMNT_0049549989 /DNA_START=363 /DNA_END=1553 /DNA_ORIENTATION=+